MVSPPSPVPPAPPAVLPFAEIENRADEVASLLKTLAHPARLLLACKLAEGEYGVGQLETALGIRQPTLSQQLGVLREAGIVATRREAKQMFYRLSEDKAARLIEALHVIFCVSEERR